MPYNKRKQYYRKSKRKLEKEHLQYELNSFSEKSTNKNLIHFSQVIRHFYKRQAKGKDKFSCRETNFQKSERCDLDVVNFQIFEKRRFLYCNLEESNFE